MASLVVVSGERNPSRSRVSRMVLAWSRLEPYLGPLILVYPMLIVAYACGLWLLLYRG